MNDNIMYKRYIEFGPINFENLLSLYIIKYPYKWWFQKIESVPIDLNYDKGVLRFRKIKNSKIKGEILS